MLTLTYTADKQNLRDNTMIDTHAHIYASEFDQDRDDVVQRALAQGINQILLPNIDLESIEPMLATEAAYPEICRSMMLPGVVFVKLCKLAITTLRLG